jgi:hypothetical protein
LGFADHCATDVIERRPLRFTESSSVKPSIFTKPDVPLDLRVVAIKARANLDGVDGARRYSLLDGECGCVTDGMSIGKALGRNTRRSHGLVFRRKTAARG